MNKEILEKIETAGQVVSGIAVIVSTIANLALIKCDEDEKRNKPLTRAEKRAARKNSK